MVVRPVAARQGPNGLLSEACACLLEHGAGSRACPTAGRLDDHEQWALGANYRLHAEGRGSYRGAGHDPLEERRHVFTGFSDYLGATYRDGVVTVLHFLEYDPRACWAERFEANAARLAEAGVGSLAVQAAFVPTRHGTNAYTDELF